VVEAENVHPGGTPSLLEPLPGLERKVGAAGFAACYCGYRGFAWGYC